MDSEKYCIFLLSGASMGSFTEWLATVRAGSLESLSPKEVEHLIKVIQPSLMSKLRSRFPKGKGRAFAEDHDDELAQRAITWLLGFFAGGARPKQRRPANGRLDEGGALPADAVRNDESRTPAKWTAIPTGVFDHADLVMFLYNKACKWSYDRYLRRSGQTGLAGEGGGSKLLARGDKEVGAQTFASISDDSRRGGPTFDAPDADSVCGDGLDAAIGDLRAWHAPDDRPVQALYLRMEEELSPDEIAENIGVSRTSVKRYLRQAKFCVMRRAGYTQVSLVREFGAEAITWERILTDVSRVLDEPN